MSSPVSSPKIVTFYSYKGGVGRTMALANTALIAAKAGKRVLVLDFDLEAPGLSTYFRLFSDDPARTRHQGLLDRLWQHVHYVSDPARTAQDDPFHVADLTLLGHRLLLGDLAVVPPGSIDFIPAGLSTDYGAKLEGFDWQRFYRDFGGAEVIARWKQAMLSGPWDLVLIDSRTGETEVAGICTQALAQRVVLCVTHSQQNVEGCGRVAAAIRSSAPEVEVWPVAMRVERNGTDLATGRRYLRDELGPYATVPSEDWWTEAEIAYQARHGQGEPLLLLEDEVRQRGTLLQDVRWLTEALLGGPLADEVLALPVADRRRLAEANGPFSDPRLRELEAGTAALPQVLTWAESITAAGAPSSRRLTAALRGRIAAWLRSPPSESPEDIDRLARIAWDWLDPEAPKADLTALLALPRVLWSTNRAAATRLAEALATRLTGWIDAEEGRYVAVVWGVVAAIDALRLTALPPALILTRALHPLAAAKASANPSDLDLQRTLSVILDRLAEQLVAVGDTAGAMGAFRDSLAIRERLAAADPSNTQWQRDLSISLNNIGGRLAAEGDAAGAMAACRDSLAIAQRLTAADPSNTQWQRDLSVSLNNIGNRLAAGGDAAGAMAAFRDSLAIRQRLAAADPSNTQWQRDLSISLDNI
ncbi:MAG: tetratricopeptide repeat protein, partial [Alphaproteobacteria bacterium]|nr:tetratricopeptide repeat protein [Alphaproteobacteria bacterium]